MKTIDAFWHGKLSLGKAFWIFGICVNFAVAFAVAVVVQITDAPVVVQTLAGITLLIGIFTWIGQWRCALNTERPFLGALLRTWLVVGTLATIGSMLPHLPASFEKVVGALILLAIVFAIVYAIFAPFRDFIRLVLYKRKHRDQ